MQSALKYIALNMAFLSTPRPEIEEITSAVTALSEYGIKKI